MVGQLLKGKEDEEDTFDINEITDAAFIGPPYPCYPRWSSSYW